MTILHADARQRGCCDAVVASGEAVIMPHGLSAAVAFLAFLYARGTAATRVYLARPPPVFRQNDGNPAPFSP
jgi:hypothetical protein